MDATTISYVLRRMTHPHWKDLYRVSRDRTAGWRGGRVLGRGGDGAAVLWVKVGALHRILEQRVEKLAFLDQEGWDDTNLWVGGQQGHMPGAVTKEVDILRLLAPTSAYVFPDFYGFRKNDMYMTMHIWMEYCTRGDLSELIEQYVTRPGERAEIITEPFIWWVFQQLAQALRGV